ncbi:MAG: protein-disulfide reductase DsbD domain-containing protein, partial [Bdellovibrionota bacterium]|nr:protein-disulfide reductase DsbD domain-containing protein [Bdellovibrionota bacterium]
MKQKILFLLNLLFFSTLSLAQFQVQSTKKVDPVSFSATVFNHKKGKYLTLTYQNSPKWHTYWKNPGDAGIPLSFEFLSSGKKIKLDSLEWPVPQRFYEKGDLLAYGYINQYSFFFPLSSKTLKDLEGKELEINSKWLVCKEICIPGKKTFKSNFTNGQLENRTNISQEELETAFNSLPKKAPFPLGLNIELHKKEGVEEFFLSYKLKNKNLAELPEKRNILTPFPQAPFDFHKEKAINGQTISANMRVQWDGEYLDPAQPFPKKNTFKKPYLLKFLYTDLSGNVSVIEKSFKGFLSKVNTPKISVTKPSPVSTPIKKVAAPPLKEPVPEKSFLAYFFFAFLGGLILNFMPCVFPVISLKLFSLLKQKSMDRASILKHNAIYSSGILFSFLILSLIVFLLKTSGEQIGWGFHLQSATFVAIMIIVLFVLSLNLFGLFEIKTPGGKLIGNIETDQSYKGDFISGILATILSTPCSAPFLGVALTFAFTSPF